MTRFDVTTFGEGQLRYSVPDGYHLETAPSFDVFVTCTEANVASLVSQLGWKCGWITGLPKTPLGNRILREYSATGIDMSSVIWSDHHRLATYYVEYAGAPRGTRVYYDRQNTCFTNLTTADIDWDYLLDTRLLHLSGLTVPLSDSVEEIIHEAMDRASNRGIPISFDMNYRSRIWTPEEAAKRIERILHTIDILFFARGDAQRMYGFGDDPETVVREIGKITSASHIITSLSSEGLIGWDRDSFYRAPAVNVSVLDRIGAGDAMVAGVLHGWLQDDFHKGLRYGALTAALALTQYGDLVSTSANEVEQLLNHINDDIVR